MIYNKINMIIIIVYIETLKVNIIIKWRYSMIFQNSYNEMITLDDLCEMLSIGKNTAYRLLQTGQIHAFKIGRIWKIPRDAVSEFVEKKSKR